MSMLDGLWNLFGHAHDPLPPEVARSMKWDGRFLALAEGIASWSKDPSTKTGAVLVRPDRTICATGYNGFPRGMGDGPERYADREDKLRRVIHCEMNAILTAHEPSLRGYTLYTWPFISCYRCAVHVVQAGIARCVAPAADPAVEERWELWRTREFLRECGVELHEVRT